MKKLQKMHPNDVFTKLSLDGFYYGALGKAAIKNRDRSQIFSKYDEKKRILYVGQLWALWINESEYQNTKSLPSQGSNRACSTLGTLITASQGVWEDANILSPAERFARGLTNASSTKTLYPNDICYELQELCVDLINYRAKGDENKVTVHQAFSREIAEVVSVFHLRQRLPC